MPRVSSKTVSVYSSDVQLSPGIRAMAAFGLSDRAELSPTHRLR